MKNRSGSLSPLLKVTSPLRNRLVPKNANCQTILIIAFNADITGLK
jgi:hypothetical protein